MSLIRRFAFLCAAGLVLGGAMVGRLGWAQARPSRETLVVGLPTPPELVDPRFGSMDGFAFALEALRFLPLVTRGERGELRNLLAQSVESRDLRVWTVELRQGVRFAFGRELNAEDVAFSYHYFLSGPGVGSARSALWKDVAEVKPISNYRLEFRLKEPRADFRQRLILGVLPVEAGSVASDAVVGKGFETGPYLGDKIINREMFYKINVHFSAKEIGMDPPKMAVLRIRPFADWREARMELEKGSLDVVPGEFDPYDLSSLQKGFALKNYRILKGPPHRARLLVFDRHHPVLGNPKVRSAIQKALDVRDMVQFSQYGMAIPADSLFPEGNPRYHKGEKLTAPDPVAAGRLLDGVKLRDPDRSGPEVRFTVSFKTGTNPDEIGTAKAIAAQLSAIGIGVVVEVLDSLSFKRQLSEGKVSMWFEDFNVADDAVRSEDPPFFVLWHRLAFAIVHRDVDGFKPSATKELWSLLSSSKR